MVARNHDRGLPKSARQSKCTRTLSIAHRCDGWPLPMKVRSDVSSSLAAGRAYEPRLKIGQPDVVGPAICADRGRVAAMVVRAIDEDAAHASIAHFSEGNLLRSVGQCPMIPPQDRPRKLSIPWGGKRHRDTGRRGCGKRPPTEGRSNACRQKGSRRHHENASNLHARE
jgi:hypothetical protein